jgi:O-acetyl-ADP-ribose deacetylase (regulator of RNase III)
MGSPRIEIVLGDITRQAVDAVVNAANTAMEPGGGVDGAITRAAGATALEQRRAVARERGVPPLETGDAVATDAGELSARWIIHTAGPVFSGDDRDPKLLASCHVRSLEVADELGARSVAFPAISCGIYGYPADLAAPVALSSVAGVDTQVSVVRFVLFDEETYGVFRAAGIPFSVSDEA